MLLRLKNCHSSGALPEPVQQALSAVSDAANSTAQQAAGAAAAAPIPAAAVAAGAVVAPLIIQSRRFRGYGGLVEPAQAFEILQANYPHVNVVLPQSVAEQHLEPGET